MFVEPSPKFHKYAVPFWLLFVIVTSSGEQPLNGVAVKEATGGSN